MRISMTLVLLILLGAITIRVSYAEEVQLSVGSQQNRQEVSGEIIIEIKNDIIDLGNGKGKVPAKEIIIRSKTIASVSKRHKLISIERLFSGTRKSAPTEIYVFRFPPEVNINEIVSAYQKDANVIYAEPNYTVRTQP